MNHSLRTHITRAAALLVLVGFAGRAEAIDAAHREQAEKMAAKAIEYLKSKQDAKTGGWSVPPDAPDGKGRPALPAISALVVSGLMMQPGATLSDPAIAGGVKYVMSFRKPDGGIYSTILPAYNTSIALSMIAKVDSDECRAAIKPAQEFIKASQWGAPAPVGVGGASGKEAPIVVDEKNPNFGGWGYGSHGRPDISNTSFAIQALHDSELSREDPAFKRALVFLQRLQMDGKVNDQPYAKGSKQGGFVYAAGDDMATSGQGSSNSSGMIEETMDDGTNVSRLRCYGSVTYSGFKSYIYAGLTMNDPRVQAALKWMQTHYTAIENPGMGINGYYYNALAMSRALGATGSATISVSAVEPMRVGLWVTGLTTGIDEAALRAKLKPVGKVSAVIMMPASAASDPKGTQSAIVYMSNDAESVAAEKVLTSKEPGGLGLKVARQDPALAGKGERDWQNDLIDALARMQNPDGSFRPIDSRWMENDPTLITAFSLLSIQQVVREDSGKPIGIKR